MVDLALTKRQFKIHTHTFLLWELRQMKCQIYSTPGNGNLRFILDRFLLWELSQIKWQIYPTRPWQFQIHTDRFLLQELRQIKCQIYSTPGNANLRFIWIDSYSESSGRSSSRFNPPPENGNLTFIWIDSYSKSSGRSSGRSTPTPQERAISDSYW